MFGKYNVGLICQRLDDRKSFCDGVKEKISVSLLVEICLLFSASNSIGFTFTRMREMNLPIFMWTVEMGRLNFG